MPGERYAYRTLTVTSQRGGHDFHIEDSDAGGQDVRDGRVILQMLTKLGNDGWHLFQYMSEDSTWPYGVFLLERRLEAATPSRRPFAHAVSGARSPTSRA